jgi:predicted metalloprotease
MRLPVITAAGARGPNSGVVLAAVLVVALLGVVGMVGVASALSPHGSRTAGPGYERYPPAARGSVSAAAIPAPTITAAVTPAPSSSSTPQATTAPQVQPVLRLGDNPLFRGGLGLGPVDCSLPVFAADPAVQAAFYRAAVRCLDRAWLPLLRSAGLPADAPRVEVPTGPFDSPCGNRQANAAAFYCKGTIYMPSRYFSDVERLPANRASLFLSVLAHEYGHHVQELSGVMDAVWERRYDAGVNSPAGLELSRRNELEATCFGGMFYASAAGRGSISRTMLDDARADQSRRGDHPETGLPRDHGTPANNGAWFLQGARLNQTFQCNTWQASSATVS